MQAAEAISHLIQCADRELSLNSSIKTDQPELSEQEDRLQLAISVSQAMLNSMIPVARFRAFVEIDNQQPKRTARQRATAVYHEFTVCGITMGAIRSGLVGLSSVPTNCRVLVFEQRATGADVICGFQGESKTQKYRNFLAELDKYEAPSPAVN